MNKKNLIIISFLTIIVNYNSLYNPLVNMFEGYTFVALSSITTPTLSLTMIRAFVIILYTLNLIAYTKLSKHYRVKDYYLLGVFVLLFIPYFFEKYNHLTLELVITSIISIIYLALPNLSVKIRKNQFTKKLILRSAQVKNSFIKKIGSKLYTLIIASIAIIYILPSTNFTIINIVLGALSLYYIHRGIKIKSQKITILSAVTFLAILLGTFSYVHTSLFYSITSLVLLQLLVKNIESKFDVIKDYRITKFIFVIVASSIIFTNYEVLSDRWNSRDNQPYLETLAEFQLITEDSDSKVVYNSPIYRTDNAIKHTDIDVDELLKDQYYIALDTRINDKQTNKILEAKNNFNIVLSSSNGEVLILSTIERNPTALLDSWEFYKEKFITENGQVIDLEENISTSEGQSYAMLRAVLLEDKDTFDLVWDYTKLNFQARQDDSLLSWKMDASTEEIIDFQIATDADIDTATALLLASKKWDGLYLNEAKILISDIWEKLVFEINGTYYLGFSDSSFKEDQFILNPSYFAPYAYRMFQTVDNNNWEQLAEDSYKTLNQISQRTGSTTLPPNWIGLNVNTQAYEPADIGNKNKDDYGFDAFRTYFRVALDYQQFGSSQAKNYLDEHEPLLTELYDEKSFLPSVIEVDYEPISNFDNPSTNTALISLWLGNEEKEVKSNTVIFKEYNKTHWGKSKNYYDQNWGWFSLALYNDKFELNQNFDN